MVSTRITLASHSRGNISYVFMGRLLLNYLWLLCFWALLLYNISALTWREIVLIFGAKIGIIWYFIMIMDGWRESLIAFLNRSLVAGFRGCCALVLMIDDVLIMGQLSFWFHHQFFFVCVLIFNNFFVSADKNCSSSGLFWERENPLFLSAWRVS